MGNQEEFKQAFDKLMNSEQLDKLEAEILKNMKFYGGSDWDIEKVKEWLRPEMNKQMLKLILEKATEKENV